MKVTITGIIIVAAHFLSLGQYSINHLVDANKFGISSDTLKKMDAYFHSLVDEKKLAGIQTAVIRKGQLIHFDTYGAANMEAEIALDEHSIFRIFSMTKPIVSVALMQLYEQGKFKLEDPLYLYIPEFKDPFVLVDSNLVPAKNPIRIIDLLRHTSGYNYGRSRNAQLRAYYDEANLYSSNSNEEFVKKLSKVPLQFEPGTNWQYGLSTNICGYLIEVLSGQSLNDYLYQSVLKPLKMEDTHFQLPLDKVDQFTIGYGWDADSGLFVTELATENRYVNEVTVFNGGGGLVSTTFDYLKFCQMLLNKGQVGSTRILKESTIDLMFSDHLEETRQQLEERIRLPLGEASFGLGFAIRGESTDALEPVYGWGGAVGTYFKVDLEHDLAYVMMIQISPYRHLELRKTLQEFIESAILK